MENKEGGFASTAEEPATKVKGNSRQHTKGRETGYSARVAVPARADRPATEDALNRSHYVRALTALIRNRNTEVPLTIGIYGRWGSGKSSFMEQLRQQLSAMHEVVDFNPWRYSETKHILIGLIRAIAGPLDRQLSVFNRIRFLFNRSFLSSFTNFQKRMSAACKNFGNWLTAGLGGLGVYSVNSGLDATASKETQNGAQSKAEIAAHQNTAQSSSFNDPTPGTDVLKFIADWLKDAGVTAWLHESGIAALMIPANLSVALFAIVGLVLLWKLVHTIRHPFATQFEAYLGSFGTSADEIRELTRDDLNKMSEIIGGYTSKNTGRGPKPIVILLDDLDRCPPDSIVEVLEAINLFLMNLPFITVFGLDSKVVTQAVAERYHFMLDKDADQRDREEYGRFFLEKIINIPFQLPTPQSFDSYIELLIRRRDPEKEKAEKETSKKRRKNIPIGFAFEAFKRRNDLGRIFLFPMFLYMDFLHAIFARVTRDEEKLWQHSLQNRILVGLPLNEKQNKWLDTQSYRRQEQYRAWAEEMKGLGLFAMLEHPSRLTNVLRRAEDAVLAREVEIQETDFHLLQRFTKDVRGNPRSVKRFINTYQLTKGICSELALDNEGVPPLKSLAAWLVILQNWPFEGSVLYSRVRGMEDFELQESWTTPTGEKSLPSDMISFIKSNFDDLKGLATATTGFDIPGCFSFVMRDFAA